MKFSLKAARAYADMTQEEAAKALDISVSTLRKMEQGKSYPDVPMLRKIEQTYGIPFDCLTFK